MQMKKVNFGSTGKQVPAIVMGCMRMKELTVKEAAKLVDAAMAEGVDFFDHAVIYGGGVCKDSEQIIWILFFFTDRMRSWNQKR